MIKVDKTVKRETTYIALFVLALSVLMQAVFLIIGQWDYTVLLGNVLSYIATVLNFFLMGLTVQKAVTKDEKQAANIIRRSQSLRMLMLFVIAILGVTLPFFNLFAVLIPLLFARIAVAFRPMFGKNKSSDD